MSNLNKLKQVEQLEDEVEDLLVSVRELKLELEKLADKPAIHIGHLRIPQDTDSTRWGGTRLWRSAKEINRVVLKAHRKIRDHYKVDEIAREFANDPKLNLEEEGANAARG